MNKHAVISLMLVFLGFQYVTGSNIFLQGSLNRNYVIGLYNGDFVPVNGYSFGMGYGSSFDHRYGFSLGLIYRESGFLEEYSFTSNQNTHFYSSKANFSRLNTPILFQVHYPRFFVELGPGLSFLLSRKQTETYTFDVNNMNPDVLELRNQHDYPGVELSLHLGFGIRLHPNLDLKFNIYQGVNDIGKGFSYSWQKNTQLGIGIALNLFPRTKIPPFSKNHFISANADNNLKDAEYKVHYANNIVRYNFQKMGDYPNFIQFRFRNVGSGSNMVQSINLESSTGNVNVSQSIAEINNVEYPIIGSLRYLVMNATGSAAFECNFNFEILEPGSWIISIQN